MFPVRENKSHCGIVTSRKGKNTPTCDIPADISTLNNRPQHLVTAEKWFQKLNLCHRRGVEVLLKRWLDIPDRDGLCSINIFSYL